MTNRQAVILSVLVSAFVSFLALAGFFIWVAPEPNTNSAKDFRLSAGAVIVRDLAAGKSISKADFEHAFSTTDMRARSAAIRWAATDLGLDDRELTVMLAQENYSVVYNGPESMIPAKLRSATQPTTAPAYDYSSYTPTTEHEPTSFPGGYSYSTSKPAEQK